MFSGTSSPGDFISMFKSKESYPTHFESSFMRDDFFIWIPSSFLYGSYRLSGSSATMLSIVLHSE